MKLIIDIPEEIYNEIKEKHSISLEHFISYTAYLTLAVECGTPLPKEYGRLADADKVIDKLKSIERLHTDDALRVSVLDAINTSILSEADKE